MVIFLVIVAVLCVGIAALDAVLSPVAAIRQLIWIGFACVFSMWARLAQAARR